MSKNLSIYTPTFMERILGKNYKWWYAIIYNFKLSYQYRLQLIIALIRFFIPILTTYIIINVTTSNSSLNLYILAGSFFFQIFAFVIGPSFDIANYVINGKFSTYLIRPSNFFGMMICQIFGYNFVLLIVRLITILIAAYLFNQVNLLDISLIRYIALIPYIALITIIGFLLEVILGSIVFWQNQITKNIIPFVFDMMPFLSGSLIPFDLNSNLFFLRYTPVSYYAYHPMQIYLGKYDTNQTILVEASPACQGSILPYRY